MTKQPARTSYKSASFQTGLTVLRWLTRVITSLTGFNKVPIQNKKAVQIVTPQYGMDQIVGVLTGVLAVPAGGPNDEQAAPFVTQPSGMSSSFYTKGLWSVDGVNWIDLGGKLQGPNDPVAGPLSLTVSARSKPDGSVTIVAVNYIRSAFTVQYKVALIAKYNQGLITPQPTNRKLKYSSRNNYMKIAKGLDGSIDVAGGTIATIAHNLGYIPHFSVWGITTINGDSIDLQEIGNENTIIDANNLYLSAPSFPGASVNVKFYYRIYLDD